MHQTVVEGENPRNVADAVLSALQATSPSARYRVGGDSRVFGVFLRLFPLWLIEFLVGKKFAMA